MVCFMGNTLKEKGVVSAVRCEGVQTARAIRAVEEQQHPPDAHINPPPPYEMCGDLNQLPLQYENLLPSTGAGFQYGF